jgi:predicted dehydrogenase
MLAACSPDVVHVTTPPQSHLAIGRRCLEWGSHVYLEKPFAVTSAEANELIECATRTGRRITAGHNYQFTPEMIEMRRLVSEGFLGGPPVHLESYWSYDLGDLSYVGPMLGNAQHWIRRLPGQLFHNIISHGIARLAEFLDDDISFLSATAYQSSTLRGLGGREIRDELRVMLRDGCETTAAFCFSTQIRPGVNRFELFGPSNSLHVDLNSGSTIRARARSFKSYLTFVMPQVVTAREQLRSARRNLVEILGWRLYQDSGMKELIERFHRSIETGGPPPIPYREIILTAHIMDSIFAAIHAASPTNSVWSSSA